MSDDPVVHDNVLSFRDQVLGVSLASPAPDPHPAADCTHDWHSAGILTHAVDTVVCLYCRRCAQVRTAVLAGDPCAPLPPPA